MDMEEVKKRMMARHNVDESALAFYEVNLLRISVLLSRGEYF
jgi:hypothetical protein